MSPVMESGTARTLGVVRLRGADVGAFLQGQLSDDMTR